MVAADLPRRASAPPPARGWEQQQLADEAGIALNTVQRIERGEWVAAHNLFPVCSVLDLRVEQTVDLDDPAQDFGKGSDPDRDRRLARPAATDRVATREEVLAGRAVIAALAHHHNLLEPRVDLNGVLYVRSGREGFASLWRFASVVARTLGVWVQVSPDIARAAGKRLISCETAGRTAGGARGLVLPRARDRSRPVARGRAHAHTQAGGRGRSPTAQGHVRRC